MRVIRHSLRWWTVIVLATMLAVTSAVPALAAARAETGSFAIEDNFVDAGASEAAVSVNLSGVLRYGSGSTAMATPSGLPSTSSGRER